MALLNDLARGNPDKPKGKIPVEFFERPDDVAAACPYDRSTLLAGASGSGLVGEVTPQGHVEIAGMGGGKSVQLSSELILYQGSAAVIDPKAEIARNTAAYRAEVLDHDVYCLDLGNGLPANLNPYQSCWNPLATCHPNNDDFLERIGLIADGLILQQPGTETHWNDAAKELLTGIMILTVLCPLFEKKDLLTVHDLLSTGYEDENRPADNPDSSMDGVITLMVHTAQINAAKVPAIAKRLKAAALSFSEKPDNERNSVLSTLRTQLTFLGFTEVGTVLSDGGTKAKTLHSTKEIKRKKQTIFLCISAGKLPLYGRIARIFINLLLTDLEGDKTKPAIPVAVVIEELPVIGFLKSVEVFSGYIRGCGGKFYIICQNLKQLQSTYPASWETFLGSSVIHAYANSDLTTLKYLEERLGKTAVETISKNVTTQAATGNESVSYAMHPLMTITEISRVFSAIDPLHRQLVIWPGHGPIILQRVRFWDRSSPYARHFDRYWKWRVQHENAQLAGISADNATRR